MHQLVRIPAEAQRTNGSLETRPCGAHLQQHGHGQKRRDPRGPTQYSLVYSVQHFNPGVIESYQTQKMSADQVREHFLSLIVSNNEAISKDEFIAFYNDLNVNFPHNDVFIRYVSNQWHYTP